jgi:hypothetical protein
LAVESKCGSITTPFFFPTSVGDLLSAKFISKLRNFLMRATRFALFPLPRTQASGSMTDFPNGKMF